ncbi:MAG: PQQ-like beta-propeller repeat protein [Verrucomicrobiae bacterium]|nr:PQQ-like beta-propeller repeat protein [Verrucomicrobiae bacterium]
MQKLIHSSLVTGLLTMTLSATAADWPRWRGPDANGISKETGWSTTWPASGPKQLWTAKVGIGFASFAVSQGRVFTVGNTKDTDTIFCFDANTGAEVWKHAYPSALDPKYYEGGPSATPTVDGNRVYTLSKRGVIHCLDAASGKVIWTKNLMEELKAEMPTWGFASSVLIEGNLAIVNVGAAGAALDKQSGTVIWSSGSDPAGYSTAVPFKAGGEAAVAMAIKQDVVALRVKDGKEIWRFPWKTQYDVNAADPILLGNKVFISSGYNRGGGVFDVSTSPPTNVWDNRNMRNHMNSCVLWQGHLYGVDENQLRCLVFETGEVKWTEKSVGKGSLSMADGKLIVLSERGILMVAEATPAGFKPISRAQVLSGKCWTTPVLSNGKIYCRNAAGDVVCVDVSGT